MTQGEKNLEDIQKMVTVELISSVSSISVLFAHFRTKYILQEYFKVHNQKMPAIMETRNSEFWKYQRMSHFD